jgi:Tol biopolymer transport system component
VVTFGSYATNLAAGQIDPNGFQDLFQFDRKSAEVTELSQAASDLHAVTPIGPSSAADLSADGRWVIFASEAAGLVAGQVDTLYSIDPYGETGTWDVFLRDRATGKTTLLSRSKASPPTSASGFYPALSADGNFAAFTVPGHDSNGQSLGSLTVYDRAADALILANHLPGSAGQPDGIPYGRPALSADGRWIAYTCSECHLVAGEQSGRQFGDQGLDVYLYDRVTGTNTLVSHASGLPATTGDQDSQEPRISADGRFVVFSSVASDLVAGQTGVDDSPNVFVFDRTTGAVTLVNHTAGSPAAASGPAYYAVISADGRWIVFASQATDLVPGVIYPVHTTAIYLYDRTTGAVSLVSSAAGSPNIALYGWEPGISADGSQITFLGTGTGFVPGQGAGTATNLFVQDRATGARTLVGRVLAQPSYPEGIGAYVSLISRLSADGRVIAFTSDSPLVAGDFNQTWDAFVYDAAAQGGPMAVPPCVLFNGVLHANVRRPLTAAGACGVPATAKQVAIKLTISQGTGQGNVQLFAGTATTPAAGILRFSRGATRSAPFNVSLGNGVSSLLPFVAGNGTVGVSVEVDGYVP